MTAFTVGILFFKPSFPIGEVFGKPWFLPAVFLGVLFIVIFNLMARTAQRLGVSVASVATKMSLAIPVIFGVILYKESLSLLKVLGILVALAAVYFASVKPNTLRFGFRSLFLPLMVFLGSGVIDTSIKYLEETRIPPEEFPTFSACAFGAAGTVGILSLVGWRPRHLLRLKPLNFAGGIALGIPNFFSIYFLLKALQFPGLGSASVFTLNNVAIVMLSTLLGVVLFQEKLSLKNWLGIVLAIVSILLISLT
jgi:drug/metabolite transporter (DMT)-like permease